MTTLREYKQGAKLDSPLYVSNQYVLIGNKESITLWSGELSELSNPVLSCGYYDDCILDIRRNDLYMHDNTKVKEVVRVNEFSSIFTIDLTHLTLTQLADLFVMAWSIIPSVSHGGVEPIIQEMLSNAGESATRDELKSKGISDNNIDFLIHIAKIN